MQGWSLRKKRQSTGEVWHGGDGTGLESRNLKEGARKRKTWWVRAESWERVRREGVREGGWPIRQVRVGGTRRPGLRQAEVVIRFDTAQ